jgi:hypothetical protein
VEYDPYLTWLAAGGAEVAAAKDLDLDAMGAMARAYLGCGTDWPEGSIDHLLATIYRDLPIRFDSDGLPRFDGGAGSVDFCDAPS